MYDSYLCTINQAKTEGGVTDFANITQDSLWLDAIGKMSAWAIDLCVCSFEPVLDTVYYDVTDDGITLDGQTLDLKARLLEVATITLADATSVASDKYLLLPRGHSPYTSIYLTNASGYVWTQYTDDLKAQIAIAGYWGQRSRYSQSAWSSVTVTAEALDATETGVDVSSVASLSAGQLIRVGSEYMRIASISTLTLTVVRGVNGTTAAIHNSGDTVYLYQPDFVVSDAVARGVGWLKKRYGSFEDVQWNASSGISQLIKSTLPDDVIGRLGRYRSINAIPSRGFAAP